MRRYRNLLLAALTAAAFALLAAFPAALRAGDAPAATGTGVSGAASSVPDGVTGLSASLTAPGTIALGWNPSTSPGVTAYRIYYGPSAGSYGGTEASEGNSPITVPATSTGATLSGLPETALPVPSAPVLLQLTPLAAGLWINWSTVAGATGYRLYYSTTGFDDSSRPATFSDVLTDLLFPATGLGTNIVGLHPGTPYTVAVSAMAQRRFFISVTAVVNTGIGSAPGSSNESYHSAEVSQGTGPLQLSPLSNRAIGIPAEPAPIITLNGGGCFIASAAYGTPLAPQVRLLRQFRDRHLVTRAAGRAFVAWYYRNAPAAARYLEEHPSLKMPVRIALLPLICFAWLALNLPFSVKLLLLLGAAAGAAAAVRGRWPPPVAAGGAVK